MEEEEEESEMEEKEEEEENIDLPALFVSESFFSPLHDPITLLRCSELDPLEAIEREG